MLLDLIHFCHGIDHIILLILRKTNACLNRSTTRRSLRYKDRQGRRGGDGEDGTHEDEEVQDEEREEDPRPHLHGVEGPLEAGLPHGCGRCEGSGEAGGPVLRNAGRGRASKTSTRIV